MSVQWSSVVTSKLVLDPLAAVAFGLLNGILDLRLWRQDWFD
jgi:hypothetical protein